MKRTRTRVSMSSIEILL